jgi:poly-gamma-glutamate synthesis protein (capsule biosynthesis protein)
VGVDVVGLANNHLYDILDEGVEDTMNALQHAGFRPGAGYFGAGLSEEQAWTPALVNVKGQTAAFLGCTSITGSQHDVSYITSNIDLKGGAAACTENAIRAAVTEARANYEIVILMIHGGNEYERSPSDYVRRMTEVAREAGATLVISHHPHVVGGFDWNGTSLAAWSLGNFLFDQTVWPTFESYLLAVHLRHGQVIRAYIQPIMIEDYQPKGVTGELAEYVARGAAGREAGPFITDNGLMEVDIKGKAIRHSVTKPIDGGSESGTIFRLDRDWWVSDFSGSNAIRLGRDLLWVGSFENEVVGDQQLEAPLWNLEGPDKQLDSAYAYAGNAGVQLRRGVHSSSDVVLTPLHRILVEPGSELSVIGMARSLANATLKLQLSWYPHSEGPSTTKTIEPVIFDTDDMWQSFRFDVSVPVNSSAVGLFFRLQPPLSGFTGVDLDNIRVIEWAAPGSRFSPQYDHIRVTGRGEITVSKDLLPGRELDAIPEWLLEPR